MIRISSASVSLNISDASPFSCSPLHVSTGRPKGEFQPYAPRAIESQFKGGGFKTWSTSTMAK